MVINVTERDIQYGIQSDCGKCPIARAVLRRFPKWDQIQVGAYTIDLSRPSLVTHFGEFMVIALNTRVTAWINAFDTMNPRYIKQKPISFEIPVEVDSRPGYYYMEGAKVG